MRTLCNMLLYEAGRRPEIADLVDRVVDLTDKDIEDAVVPLPWYRKALYEARSKAREGKLLALTLEQMTPFIVDGVVPDPNGYTREWRGNDDWIDVGFGGKLQVRYGDLIWMPDAGGCWFDTLFAPTLRAEWAERSLHVERETKMAYIARRKEKLNHFTASAPNIDLTGRETTSSKEPSRLSIDHGVRFF